MGPTAIWGGLPLRAPLPGLGSSRTKSTYPRVCAWLDRIRSLPFARRNPDVVRRGVTEKFSTRAGSPYEGARIIWRGDRLEWLFANGFHGWWATELTAGRTVVPVSL